MNEPPLIIGVESEYAIAPRNPGEFGPAARAPLPLGCLQAIRSAGLISRLKTRHPHLCGVRGGLFLGNGARVYDDRGHPEYATPEASTPLEATAHLLAGRWLLHEALGMPDPGESCGYEDADGVARLPLALFDLNLDYSEQGCTGWGCHENYAFTGPASVVRQAILPHLCSRVIFSGAGGFNPWRPIAYVVSPRGLMVPQAAERNPQEALFHVRQEPYATGNIDRLHIIAGESLRSHRGIFLKVGTTALLVWLAQRGHEVSASFRPQNAHSALRMFSGDLSGHATVSSSKGYSWSALDIQRALLEMAEDAIRTDSPGDWAAPLMRLWRDSLENFALQGQLGLQRSFDWAIKWAVFDAHCQSAGISFQELLGWDEILVKMSGAIDQFGTSLSQPKVARGIAERDLKKSWRSCGIRSLDEMELVLTLRLQLRELDWRFCQVGDGIFDELNRQGMLQHDAPGLTPQMISDAMRTAPRKTRAQVRAAIINRWHGSPQARDARCDWRLVTDPEHNRMLELNDPTSVVERWTPLKAPRNPQSFPFDRAIDLHRASRFFEAAPLLRQLRKRVRWRDTNATLVDSYPFRLLRYSAWVQSRLGRLDGVEFLKQIYQNPTRGDAECYRIGDELYCYRFLGLAPHPQIEPLIGPAMEFLSRPPPSIEPSLANIREHLGAYALWCGRLNVVERLIGSAREQTTHWRKARIHCILADTFRRKNCPEEALRFLQTARENLSSGDVLAAEQILPIQAKLEPNAERRSNILDSAAATLREAGHKMGLARVLLLRARNCGSPEDSQNLRKEFGQLRRATDVLRFCPLAIHILKNWRAWTESFEPDENGDVYWGLL